MVWRRVVVWCRVVSCGVVGAVWFGLVQCSLVSCHTRCVVFVPSYFMQYNVICFLVSLARWYVAWTCVVSYAV